jgi:serine/threonine protein kinase
MFTGEGGLPQVWPYFSDGATSDIWAFGCVLYEMLTGKPVFEGEAIGEIFAELFKTEPDWSRLPSDCPEAVRRLLRRCLQKDRAARLKGADDARIEIDEAFRTPMTALPAQARTRNAILPWVTAVLATIFLTLIAAMYLREKPAPDAPEMRVEINTPATSAPLEFALSPDGRSLVFVVSGAGGSRLWLRSTGKTESQAIPGTDGADYPFWSADSRSVGFFSSSKRSNTSTPFPATDGS